MPGPDRLTSLTPADARWIRPYLALRRRELSGYVFENIFVWRSLYRIRWARLAGALCMFMQDDLGCFMPVPPLGRRVDSRTLGRAFELMDRHNPNRRVSRIENVEAQDVPFFRGLGYECVLRGQEYVYDRAALAGLRGDRFKSKRAAVNRFLRENQYRYEPFRPAMAGACRALYDAWMRQRAGRSGDPLYRGMLTDSRSALDALLGAYGRLRAQGRVVLVAGSLKAFTFGAALNPDTFCVMYEIADLAVTGLSQFIFREFCRELTAYRLINTMDDSGLENLRSVKLSYRPLRTIAAHVVQRPDA